jgi:hypothetical protein
MTLPHMIDTEPPGSVHASPMRLCKLSIRQTTDKASPQEHTDPIERINLAGDNGGAAQVGPNQMKY